MIAEFVPVALEGRHLFWISIIAIAGLVVVLCIAVVALRSHCKTVYVTFNHEPVSHDRSMLQRVGETPRNSCRFARSTVAIGDDG